MVMGMEGEPLFNWVKHKKQAPKVRLNKDEEPRQEGFRPRG